AAALRAGDLYKAAATPGRDKEVRAEAFSAWGDALAADPKTATDAAGKYAEAAREYRDLAAVQDGTTARVDFLRRAADRSRKANDPQTAADTLARVQAVGPVP